ncbi:hypothetical protein ACFYNO_16250 [Kitasatospora sp. NPDC006697]|uniref:hypothetical protein n=1 Tax=Kitasatospora sp. NPDC006697 TaxID=3364020 RepID=UPI0036D0E58D
MADEVRTVMPSIRQARAAVEHLEDVLADREVDLNDLSVGFTISPTGVVLIQFRPLLPTEIILLAEALRE